MSRFNLCKALSLLDEYDSEDIVDSDVEEISQEDSEQIEIEKKITHYGNSRVACEADEKDEHGEQPVITPNDTDTTVHQELVATEGANCTLENVGEDMVRYELYEGENLPPAVIAEMEQAGCIILDIDSIRGKASDTNNDSKSDSEVEETNTNSNEYISEIEDTSTFIHDDFNEITNQGLNSSEASNVSNEHAEWHESLDIDGPLDLSTNKGNSVSDIPATESITRSRSKQKCVDSWNKTIRKRKRQAGEEYVSSRGKLIPKKTTKICKDCVCKCKHKCAWSFNNDKIQDIHSHFWSLNDDQKLIYYAQTTERIQKGSTNHKQSDATESRRKYTFHYYFQKGGEKLRVCKDFYFGVLGIHDSRVRNYYNKLDKHNGKEYRDMRGQNTKSRIPEINIQFAIDHIASFNRVPANYCRSSSRKEYLESDLNMTRMYEMYSEKCKDHGIPQVKLSMYRHLFHTKFNIGFHTPRKDRCDTCEQLRMAKENECVPEEIKIKYEEHICDKISTKAERDADRQNIHDDSVATVCFDLENVIALPKAAVKNFFYKRKLNVFNLTAHSSIDKGVYNAIWTENEAGIGSNEIASALLYILRNIKNEHPNVKQIIIWSDACIPQNRNSIMSYALKTFMNEQNIDVITQKFGCPGHSPVQEVDNAHSSIERVMRVNEVYSPISLMRVLKAVKRKAPFKIIQMRSCHFYDFQKITNTLKFGTVPYTKVKCLRYKKENEMEIELKLCFEEKFRVGNIVGKCNTRNSASTQITTLSKPQNISFHKKPFLSHEKKKDITSMLRYMSAVDKHYYHTMKLVVEDSAGGEPQRKKQRID